MKMVGTKNDFRKQAGKLRRWKRWCPQGSKEYTTEMEGWQHKRQELKGGKNYEENGSVGFGDYDAGELGKRSECGIIWHSGLMQ